MDTISSKKSLLKNKRFLLSQQLRLLYKQLPLTGVVCFLLATFLAAIMSKVLPISYILMGYAWLIYLLVTKLIIYKQYDPDENYKLAELKRFLYYLYIDVALTGLSWSVAIIIMLMMGMPELGTFKYIAIAALSAMTILYAIHRFVYIIYQVAILLPIVAYLFTVGRDLEQLLAIFMCVLALVVWVFSKQMADALLNSFELTFENSQLSQALEQSNLDLREANTELTLLSSIDALTEISNRRFFENQLTNEISRANREEKSLSVIMLDVDFFKDYNDLLGHLTGDECLKKVAACIKATVKRPSDLVARFGGEEFIVLLADTNKEGAVHMADNIRMAIEGMEIVHPNSRVSKYVTASFGVTDIPLGYSTTRHKLLTKVDEAMYLAKSDGRNRVCYKPLVESNIVDIDKYKDKDKNNT